MQAASYYCFLIAHTVFIDPDNKDNKAGIKNSLFKKEIKKNHPPKNKTKKRKIALSSGNKRTKTSHWQ